MTQSPTYLIAMKGHPATGKSALAYALAQSLHWPLIDKDDIKDHTLNLPDGNGLAYTIMWQVVERQLALGVSVIVDSPLSYPVGYATACTLAERYQAQLRVVETYLDEEIWRARLEARPAGESTHKIRGWQAMQTQLQIYNDCWRYTIQPEHHVRVDTMQPLDQIVQLVRARVEVGKQAAAQRRALLGQELSRYIQILSQEEKIEKAIVFGSVATDEVKEWSDIDLVIVANTDLPFLGRSHWIQGLIKPKVAVDILCYTQEEFSKMCEERLFFKEEILAKGMVVYEKCKPN